ncbi:MAG TPA: dihydropteroate synthase [Planctomycetaceae bacterium]|jgi:dihydropteroate synthase|nr:dihydropteroate synthase [Planctomycetaceae bacterium]
MLNHWSLRGKTLSWSGRPLLMGIVNVTPDSFSDGGQNFAAGQAVEHALRLEDAGADLLDLGAESTRPGAEPVSLDEELWRLMPVVEQLAARVQIPLSIDTYKAEVARQTLAAGAAIINDISGLQFDPEMLPVIAETQAGVVCMHIQGTPQTMQRAPHYDDVVAEICGYFHERLDLMASAGVQPEQIVFDPGIGFGKTSEHNLQLLSHIAELRAVGRPILIGHSRKGFLKRILGRPVDERQSGTLGVSLALAEQGTDILRVHDVAATRDALAAWRTVREWKSGQIQLPAV